MKTDNKILIAVLRYLSEDGIESEDGVANAAIAEAANRLEELLVEKNKMINDYLLLQVYHDELQREFKESQEYADRLVEGMPYLPKDIEILREANGHFAEENEHYKQYIKILQEENEKIIDENTALQNQVKRLHARTSPNDRRIWL
jgi:hypothetical protein